MKTCYVTIYADTTRWYSVEDIIENGNMVDIKVPLDLCLEWYDENPDLEDEAKEFLGVDHCGFQEWLKEVAYCDHLDGFFDWLLDHGFTPDREEAIR